MRYVNRCFFFLHALSSYLDVKIRKVFIKGHKLEVKALIGVKGGHAVFLDAGSWLVRCAFHRSACAGKAELRFATFTTRSGGSEIWLAASATAVKMREADVRAASPATGKRCEIWLAESQRAVTVWLVTLKALCLEAVIRLATFQTRRLKAELWLASSAAAAHDILYTGSERVGHTGCAKTSIFFLFLFGCSISGKRPVFSLQERFWFPGACGGDGSSGNTRTNILSFIPPEIFQAIHDKSRLLN